MRAVAEHAHQAHGRRGEIAAHLREGVEDLALGGDRVERRKRAPELDGVADEPPAREHDRREQQPGDVERAELARKAHRHHDEEQDRQRPDRLLGEHGQRDRQSNPDREARGQQLALHHHDAREDQQRTGEPGEVVVIDGAGQVLRLGKEADQRRGTDGERRPDREEPARHGVDGEDREHPEDHRYQSDQPRVVPGELGRDRPEQVVQRRLLTLRLAGRRQPEVVGDAVDVVQVGQLVRRRADRRDPRVCHGEPGEDRDHHPDLHLAGAGAPEDRRPHGRRWATSARTQTRVRVALELVHVLAAGEKRRRSPGRAPGPRVDHDQHRSLAGHVLLDRAPVPEQDLVVVDREVSA